MKQNVDLARPVEEHPVSSMPSAASASGNTKATAATTTEASLTGQGFPELAWSGVAVALQVEAVGKRLERAQALLYDLVPRWGGGKF
jgi:hypothetical protein